MKLIQCFKAIIKEFIRFYRVEYYKLLEELIQDCDSCLDLGCGSNSPLSKIENSKQYCLGVDIFENYIEISKKKKIHNDYLLLNILEIDRKIPEKSFDCVLLLDVIEHLEKLDGIKLIKKIEKIAKKKIIIFTPNGFLHQDKYDDNIYQIHRSEWNYNIFKKLNFQIYGINGLKFIRRERVCIKYKPVRFWRNFSNFSEKFVKFIPKLAFHLLCVKNIVADS
ncbi:MAG: methyltransferase domain-containing protein [Promethearchaeota archaeon]